MLKDIIITIVQFIVLVFCQVFLLDNIGFLGYINPMIYVWFIIMLPFGAAHWLVLVSSFLLGFSVDIFAGDIGINALCCTLIGFLRPMFLNTFSGNIENVTYLRPSISSLGLRSFIFYMGSMVLVHHILYFLVETFSLHEIFQLIFRTLLSSIVTILLILLLDMIFYRKK